MSGEPNGGDLSRLNSIVNGRAPAPQREVSAYPLDDELVVYDTRLSQAYVLNSTAARIWSLFDGSRSVESVAGEIAADYALGFDQALADVRELVDDLQRAGLLAA
jgi:hypothetical protein